MGELSKVQLADILQKPEQSFLKTAVRRLVAACPGHEARERQRLSAVYFFLFDVFMTAGCTRKFVDNGDTNTAGGKALGDKT